MKNEKYCAAVASVSWLTDAAYPLRVHIVFRRFRYLDWAKNLSLTALADLIRASLVSQIGNDCQDFFGAALRVVVNDGVIVPASLLHFP